MAALPVIVPVAGIGVAFLFRDADPRSPVGFLLGLITFLVFAAIYGLIPYLLYLAIVWRWFRPRTLAAYRRLVYLTPVLIAVPYACIWGIYTWATGATDPMAIVFAFGVYALIDGYFYVVLIEIAYAFWRRRLET